MHKIITLLFLTTCQAHILGRSSVLFGADLYKSISRDEGNLVFSPASLQTILSLSQIGAKYRTLDEIAAVNHLPSDKGAIEQLYREVLPLFTNLKHATLRSINKIYVNEGNKVTPNFQKVCKESFLADFESIDFSNPPRAVEEINRWVDVNSNHKIQNFVKFLKPDTSMLLINALFFIGEWDIPFQKVGHLPFFNDPSMSVPQEMMEIKDEFPYKNDTQLNARFLILPYSDHEFAMTIVVPNERNGLPLLESRIHQVITNSMDGIVMKNINLVMPKFRIEKSLDLKDPLIELGMREAFQMTADFPNMLVNQTSGLFISKILQKTYIDVNELGTEAGTVTGGFFTTRIIPPKYELFVVDRPFLFLITHVDTGIVYFIGRYVGP